MLEASSAAALGQPAPPKYEVTVQTDVRIPSSVPGLNLGADVYLPVTDDPVPVLVTLHSSRKDVLAGISTRRHLRFFAQQGYAAVFADCLGAGTSDGLPRPMLSPGEIDDGVALIEWAAAQPWSTGAVGMWGYSHAGMITLAVAARQPRQLRAIFPIMGMTDPERDLVHPDGQRGGIGMFGHLSLYHLLCTMLPPLRKSDYQDYAESWQERLDRFEPWFVDAVKHAPGHPAWAARRVDPSRITVPALCVAGWQDVFCRTMISAYEQITAPKKLIVGPWLHTIPESSPVEPINSMALACEWWNRWLAGRPEPDDDPQRATIYIRGDQARWVRSAQWPPAPTQPRTFVATSNGTLIPGLAAAQPAADANTAVLRKPMDPTVGALSCLWRHPTPKLGYPVDQHDDDVRSLMFTSAPSPDPMLITGRPSAIVLVHHASTAARCVVKLADVDPDGRSTIISVGIADLSEKSAEPTGAVRSVAVELDPVCYSVASGHRIRLVLADADFPRLWPSESPAELWVLAHNDLPARPSIGVATRVTVPTCDPAALTDVTFAAPTRPARRRGPQPAIPDHSWEIVRDHYRNTVRVVIEINEAGPYSQEHDELVQIRPRLVATVGQDASTARLRGTGSAMVRTECGDHVTATAEIEIAESGSSAAATLAMNDKVVFQKRWSHD